MAWTSTIKIISPDRHTLRPCALKWQCAPLRWHRIHCETDAQSAEPSGIHSSKLEVTWETVLTTYACIGNIIGNLRGCKDQLIKTIIINSCSDLCPGSHVREGIGTLKLHGMLHPTMWSLLYAAPQSPVSLWSEVTWSLWSCLYHSGNMRELKIKIKFMKN